MAFVLIAIISYLIFQNSYKVNCDYNKDCFDKRAANCLGSKYTYENSGNLFQYKVNGNSYNNTCSISINLLKTSPVLTYETRQAFEGKSMSCNFPKELLAISPIQETSNILNYCTGPLKEATLELMIKKLYGSVAQNLGTIINKINDQSANSLINPGNKDILINNKSSSIIVNNGSIQN